MQDQDSPGSTTPKRVPWNKGKLTGAKPPLRPSTSGRSEPSSRSKAVPETWRCSTWQSTASCAAAMSSP